LLLSSLTRRPTTIAIEVYQELPMALPKIILVPTDFGELSDAALDYAIDLSRVLSSEIILMHAYEIPIVGFPDGAIVATAELTAQILEGAKIGLDQQLASRSNRGVQIRGLIKQGEPYRMVNEAVDELGVGLVVMGTHGRKGIPRVLIGSVAEKVVRTSKVPVLTVHTLDGKPEAQERPAKATANGRDAPSHR
jgi:nucleotide-binding universal stress UspA family protein